MYMMATFMLSASLYFLLKIFTLDEQVSFKNSNVKTQNSNLQLKTKSCKYVILFNLFIGLSVVTFYGSVFLIAGFLIYFMFKKHYKYFFVSCLVLSAVYLVISPLLLKQLANSKEALKTVTNWSLVLGKANLKNMVLIHIKFAFGRISFYPKAIYYLVAGVWTGVVFYFVVRGGFKNRLLIFLFIVSLFLGFVFSFISPLLQYFRFLYLLPLMCLLISFVSSKNWQRWLLIAGFLTLSLIYLFNPKFHREDWKSLALSLDRKSVV